MLKLVLSLFAKLSEISVYCCPGFEEGGVKVV